MPCSTLVVAGDDDKEVVNKDRFVAEDGFGPTESFDGWCVFLDPADESLAARDDRLGHLRRSHKTGTVVA